MSVETVELTGEAIYGVDTPPEHPDRARIGLMPRTVKLGRTPVRPEAMKKALKLGDYIAGLSPVPLPATVKWQDKAMASLSRMYKNDQYGDCVIAGKGHFIGAVTGNDPDHQPEGVVVATDQEIVNTYQSWCGPGDNGCNIEDVLRRFVSEGMTFSGQRRKIDGYVGVDWTKKDLVKAAIYCLGGLCIGINLPSAWTNDSIWDVTSSRIVGGHDVQCVGYDDAGVQISSWGRIYTITWAAFLNTRWLEESWAMLAPDWYGNDKLAPSGFKVDELRAAITALGRGNVPDAPTPPAPPVPPIPVPPVVHESFQILLRGMAPSGIWGTMVPITLEGVATPMTGRAGGQYGAVPWSVIWGLVWKLAPIIATDLALGKTPADIAKDIIAALFSAQHVERMTAAGFNWQELFNAIKVIIDFIQQLFPQPPA